MNRRILWMGVIGALALMGATALFTYWMGRSLGSAEPSRSGVQTLPKEVTAAVRVVPVRESVLSRTATAYGNVVPPPGGVRTVSVPFDCQIVTLSVREGQAASRGMLLMTVTGSPDAKLALVQARAQAHSDAETYHQVEARHRLKLADDATLAQAKGAFEASEARLKSLEARGLAEAHPLASPVDGTVLRLPFSQGAVVPAGTALAEVAGLAHLEALLGLEPGDAHDLHPGAPVDLDMVGDHGGPPLKGVLSSVSPAINPSTRLVDAYVALPRGCSLPLGAYVRGTFTLTSAKGLVVPYAAVLPAGSGGVLYTVRDGRAVRHEVRVVVETSDEAQVSAPGLAAGDLAVVTGNYELENGMAVKVEPHP
ncbi:MAG: efflux RND transporter periplasmic adaptor subunit [Acidobacteriota bacterium]